MTNTADSVLALPQTNSLCLPSQHPSRLLSPGFHRFNWERVCIKIQLDPSWNKPQKQTNKQTNNQTTTTTKNVDEDPDSRPYFPISFIFFCQFWCPFYRLFLEWNSPLQLECFVFPIKVSGEFAQNRVWLFSLKTGIDFNNNNNTLYLKRVARNSYRN